MSTQPVENLDSHSRESSLASNGNPEMKALIHQRKMFLREIEESSKPEEQKKVERNAVKADYYAKVAASYGQPPATVVSSSRLGANPPPSVVLSASAAAQYPTPPVRQNTNPTSQWPNGTQPNSAVTPTVPSFGSYPPAAPPMPAGYAHFGYPQNPVPHPQSAFQAGFHYQGPTPQPAMYYPPSSVMQQPFTQPAPTSHHAPPSNDGYIVGPDGRQYWLLPPSGSANGNTTVQITKGQQLATAEEIMHKEKPAHIPWGLPVASVAHTQAFKSFTDLNFIIDTAAWIAHPLFAMMAIMNIQFLIMVYAVHDSRVLRDCMRSMHFLGMETISPSHCPARALLFVVDIFTGLYNANEPRDKTSKLKFRNHPQFALLPQHLRDQIKGAGDKRPREE